MIIFMALLAAFLMGSLPTAFLWVKVKTGKDIRTLGSGNVGATNVFRTTGKVDGISVLFIDALKGYLAVLILGPLLPSDHASPATNGLYIGLLAILGHVFSPFLRFKGGKGVATSLGVGLAVYPLASLAAILAWSIVLAISKKMSLASISGASTFLIIGILFFESPLHQCIAFFLCILIIWTHRSNIRRLLKGDEPSFFKR